MKYRSNLVKEDDEAETLWETDTWAGFKKHAELICQFMNVSKQDIQTTLTKLENVFSTLGDGKVDSGLKRVNQIEKVLTDSGI